MPFTQFWVELRGAMVSFVSLDVPWPFQWAPLENLENHQNPLKCSKMLENGQKCDF
eukprot:NODE_1861_length_537_cov_17.325820_g1511_i0.p1 GENE.NODE_1861_length_537_cov_17.325820_g1511_i0~~NODE_1861_length_537_cov_17.325820_g1511_i0.p1  ORF type:complete len:56 (+),score=3.21 NODE_1861_length_537_cov_17.325820_g1511_i0:179-346(+)